jgi:hypothetical protein
VNRASKKLRELEGNVLGLPDDDEIFLSISDRDEAALHERAYNIRSGFRDEAREILFSGKFTFKQQNAKAEDLLKQLSEAERTLFGESDRFLRFRLMRLLYKQFSPVFPKAHCSEVWQRIVWFFGEMDKLVVAKAVEDSEWDFNRDEEDPAFDDYAWWNDLDAKIRGYYPDGVFTKESYEAVKRFFDEKQSELIRNYWKAHPEEHKKMMKNLDAKLESLKNAE